MSAFTSGEKVHEYFGGVSLLLGAAGLAAADVAIVDMKMPGMTGLDLAAADLRSNRYAEAMALVREVVDAAEPLRSRPLLDRAEQQHRHALMRHRDVDLDSGQ